MRLNSIKYMALVICLTALFSTWIVYAAVAPSPVKPVKPPEIKALRIKQPPAIDGVVDNIWQRAPVLPLVANNGPGAGSSVSLRSEARVMWDKNNLYVLFLFEDPSVTFAYVSPDDILWDSGDKLDLAEMLLQPDAKSKIYYEFAVNPYGAPLDAQVKWKKGAPTWNLLWPAIHPPVAAGRIKKGNSGIDGWCVEISFPFDSIGFVPGSGKSVRANFHRADVDLSTKWLSWSPTLTRTIHVPAKFGRIVF